MGILFVMLTKKQFDIREITTSDRPWTINLVEDRWGSNRVVTRGIIHEIKQLPGFIALFSGDRIGLLTYFISEDEFEIVTLDSLVEKIGVGTALLSKAREFAKQAGCHRIWLITTNDNMPALRFYQKRGFQLVAVHHNALDYSRTLKPEIPLIGLDGIPLRDEIELELVLNS
jgi:GNAT superfamily N-acetyltransferase